MSQLSPTPEASLFERIGGEPAVDAAVDLFYTKVMSDDLLTPFFEGVDMKRQAAKQKMFMTYAFGGRPDYPGRAMRAAHADAVAKGLSDEHFDAVAGHLQTSLEELNVPSELIGEVMTIVGSTRDDVLNR